MSDFGSKKKENHQNFAGNPFLRVIKCNGAWVTRPERPKGAKDEVKEARRAKRRPEGPQTRSRASEGP